MKKRFTTIIRNPLTAIILGILIVVSSIGVGGVAAQEKTIEPFLGNLGSLSNRVGSLFIGRTAFPNILNRSLGIDNIFGEEKKCISANIPDGKQTCLDVAGWASFWHLLVDQRSALATSPIDNQKVIIASSQAGDNFIESNISNTETSAFIVQDNILLRGLAYLAGSNLAPRDDTSRRNVCTTDNGTLVTCGEVLAEQLFYAWQTSEWGSCSNPTAGVCSGSFSQTTGGSCNGQYVEVTGGSCSGTQTLQRLIDWNGDEFDWDSGFVYAANGQTITACGAGGNYSVGTNLAQQCIVVSDLNANIESNTNTGNAYVINPSTTNSWIELTISADWTITSSVDSAPSFGTQSCSALDENLCTNPAYAGCSWSETIATRSCAGPTSLAVCESNSSCSWSETSSTVSCGSATSASSCTGQNSSACTWTPPGESIKTRTVSCTEIRNGVTTIVSDQFCIDNITEPKPTDVDQCEILPETYRWYEGDWGSCSEPSSSMCSGNYVESLPGYCSGDYVKSEQVKIDWNGDVFDWSPGVTYNDQTTDTNSCRPNSYIIDPLSNTWSVIPHRVISQGRFGSDCIPVAAVDTRNPIYQTTTSTHSCSAAAAGACSQENPACSWEIETLIRFCDGATSRSTCEDQNPAACEWTESGESVKTRPIVCIDTNGQAVSDGFCTQTKPASSINCETNVYSWVEFPWGACVGGVQNRTLSCEDPSGNVVANSLCSSAAQPRTTQRCQGPADPVAAPRCVSYTSPEYAVQPANSTSTGCLVGSYTDLSDSAATWQWRCENGSQTPAVCTASRQRATGTSAGGPAADAPFIEGRPDESGGRDGGSSIIIL